MVTNSNSGQELPTQPPTLHMSVIYPMILQGDIDTIFKELKVCVCVCVYRTWENIGG